MIVQEPRVERELFAAMGRLIDFDNCPEGKLIDLEQMAVQEPMAERDKFAEVLSVARFAAMEWAGLE